MRLFSSIFFFILIVLALTIRAEEEFDEGKARLAIGILINFE